MFKLALPKRGVHMHPPGYGLSSLVRMVPTITYTHAWEPVQHWLSEPQSEGAWPNSQGKKVLQSGLQPLLVLNFFQFTVLELVYHWDCETPALHSLSPTPLRFYLSTPTSHLWSAVSNTHFTKQSSFGACAVQIVGVVWLAHMRMFFQCLPYPSPSLTLSRLRRPLLSQTVRLASR